MRRTRSFLPSGTSWLLVAFLLILLGARLAGAEQHALEGTRGERTGAWVDSIQFSEEPSPYGAVTQLQNDSLDIYAATSADPFLYNSVVASDAVVAHTSMSGFGELTINPVGPTFNNGKLNPFSVPEIRSALNRLIDRAHIVDDLMGGLGVPRYTAIGTSSPDYVRYFSTLNSLETLYSYEPVLASNVIGSEMSALGATLVEGVWHYNGEPVVLIFLIRTEDERTAVGDYVADQLENAGFTVDRQYVTSSEASPIWLQGDPADGEWHLYTGLWIRTTLERDESGNFEFFFTPAGLSFPLWQAYDPVPEFEDAAARLADRNFADLNERAQLVTDALTLSMADSVHLFLYETSSFVPRRDTTTLAYNLVGNTLNDLWPYTVRFSGQEGGTMRIAQPAQLVQPWNPVAGSNWIYDGFARRALQDDGAVIDPFNGLARPQRLASADVYVQSGLPVTSTLDWVTLTVSPTITVPDDAWVDWDATAQVWRTAAEVYPQPETALVKSVVTYPADFFDTVTWHDGSPISMADFVMEMIFPFDVADPASPIYDAALEPPHQSFLSTFRGYRITSTDPLVIEYYTNFWELDAELMVNPLWPAYYQAEAPWHVMGISYLAAASGDAAFTSDKADALQIPWLNLLDGPSLGILDGHLSTAQATDFFPYAATLNAFLTPAEVTARWSNLRSWYNARGHFWVGAGPFLLDTVSFTDGTMTMARFPDFPDAAGRWDAYAHDASPVTLDVNYSTGAPGSAFNITGAHFPVNRGATVSVNGEKLGSLLVPESGTFTVTLQTGLGTENGFYLPLVSVNPAAETRFEIDPLAPVRPLEGNYQILGVPDDIAVTQFRHLPILITE